MAGCCVNTKLTDVTSIILLELAIALNSSKCTRGKTKDLLEIPSMQHKMTLWTYRPTRLKERRLKERQNLEQNLEGGVTLLSNLLLRIWTHVKAVATLG